MAVKFEYDVAPISSLRVITVEGDKKKKHIIERPNGDQLGPTDRFWNSMYSRFGFGSNIFKYFSHEEVFDRISQVNPNDKVRLCIENNADENGKNSRSLMAVSGPEKPLMQYDDLQDVLGRYDSSGVNYCEGVVDSTHTPRVQNKFSIAGDLFETRFNLHTPIDGYGSPSVYLSVLRIICTNGAVGFSNVFKSSITLGKSEYDVSPALMRVLDGFGHDEGYAAIQNRLEAATTSWASVADMQDLYKLLTKMYSSGEINDKGGLKPQAGFLNKMLHRGASGGHGKNVILDSFHRMTGDPSERYGLANLDAMSGRKQRLLPVECKVYDMINFASEVATHHAEPAGARKMHAWFGSMISKEYDLEGTGNQFKDFADFHITAKLNNQLTGVN